MTRWPARLALLAAAVLLLSASCSGSAAVEPGQVPQEPVDTAETAEDPGPELTITVEYDIAEKDLPRWEDFEVVLTEVVFVDEVTAIGDMADGLTLLGDSCEQLQAEYPEIAECVEEVVQVAEYGPEANIGNLDAEGTLTIPAPKVASSLWLGATHPNDELCSTDGFAELEPGQTSVVVFLEQSCA